MNVNPHKRGCEREPARDREREHQRETQGTKNVMVWNVNPRTRTRIRTFIRRKTEINYAELNNTFGSYQTMKNTINAGTGLINNKFSFVSLPCLL